MELHQAFLCLSWLPLPPPASQIGTDLSKWKEIPDHSHLWRVVVRITLGWMSPRTGPYVTGASLSQQYKLTVLALLLAPVTTCFLPTQL